MNGIHDLGGRDGLGAVAPPPEEPVWKAEWEKHAHTLFPMAFRAGMFGVDAFRYGMEQMDPVEYLTSPYYEHWLHSVQHHGIRTGHWDLAEVDERTRYYLENPDAPLPEDKDPDGELVAFIEAVVPAGAPASRDTGKAATFSVGDRVTVVSDAPRGHTRKAGYVRGKTGVIVMAHGEMVYPDTAGNSLDETSEHVYTVQFTAEDLWGAEAAEPNGTSTFDVWEPYIVPAAS
ncbi:nitrile hydratase subunit beta [Pseudonocardia sp. KRD291]|uniref:nitrile hydratase subunit beta n=1 Tax=Pseudonocardia sp. KRD291 TaxID=2792007 RepID=UPI001C4A68DF|nr:nitrile hydratase subunit beta [Pseudonocardia sp. KRD291]MBW0101375.1 nitrile hydratase subunit beta [Pseudonocardia sp. KRD291]